VLLNYTDRRGLFQLPKVCLVNLCLSPRALTERLFAYMWQLIRNKHITPLLTTEICILAAFVTPFAAAYIRLAPITSGPFTPLAGVMQLQQLTLPDDLPYADANAAAAYANAAASFSVNPPALTMFNGGLSWSVAAVVS
jgi:hypothetical protein